jgi:hypothetical protein
MNETPQAPDRVYGQLMARIWIDEDFKRQFMADPGGVLREHGVDVPEGAEVVAVENTPERFYIAIPSAPSADVSEEELETVAGGGSTVGSAGTAGSVSSASCPLASMGTAFCAGTAGTV